MHNDSKRIAKNTLFLYLRMLIILGVSLYTSRVVLDTLGVENYGVYSIVASIVVLFSFISNSMIGACQRFFSYDIGNNDFINLKHTFGVSKTAHLTIVIIVIILGETVGLWFLNSKLNIPVGRMVAANFIYQFSLLTFVSNILRIPYNAIIISYEKMSFFAYMSILEVILKLGILYLLLIIPGDKLIIYGLLSFLIVVLCTEAYRLFCIRCFDSCRSGYIWDKSKYKEIMSFSGWTMTASVANIGAQQGGNIILNLFYGVALNTSYGIATQVSSAIYGFVSNFQLAFKPQIVKLYASDSKDELYELIIRASRLSFYLLLLIAVPFVVNAEYVFNLWLKNVPDYSIEFCKLLMLYFLIDSIQAPLWMLIDATGKVRDYEIWLSFILILNLPISYYCLKAGCMPSILLVVRVILNFITAIIRTIYVRGFVKFPSYKYVKATLPCLVLALIIFLSSYCAAKFMNGRCNDILVVVGTIFITSLYIYMFGLHRNEKKTLFSLFYGEKVI